MIELNAIVLAIISGISYSLYWYVNKVLDPTTPVKWTDIDPYPVVATALVGAFIGAFMFFSNVEITQISFEAQFLAYGALVAIVERGIRTIVRVMKDRGII